MKIKVIKPGLFTTVQDNGRFGYEAHGIPQSGWLDHVSANNANALVGNGLNEALLEITGTGPTLEFDTDGVIAICGALLSPLLNNEVVTNDKAIKVTKGDVLKFGRLKNGYRAYVAIQGMLNIDEVYGSKSTNVLAAFGGFEGRPLQKGDELEVFKPDTVLKSKNNQVKVDLSTSRVVLQITPGPEMDRFTYNELSAFMSTVYTVSKDSNRMGIRLEGDWLSGKLLETIISSGNIPGVIQVTPSLQPIILLNDAGTTGGYPRIGVCNQKSISRLAQLKPGDTLEFSF